MRNLEYVAVQLSESERMALCDVIAGYLQVPDHLEEFVDVIRGVKTRPEDLLAKLVGVGGPVNRATVETTLRAAVGPLTPVTQVSALLRVLDEHVTHLQEVVPGDKPPELGELQKLIRWWLDATESVVAQEGRRVRVPLGPGPVREVVRGEEVPIDETDPKAGRVPGDA